MIDFIDNVFRYRWHVLRLLNYVEGPCWSYELARFRTRYFARRYLRAHAVFRYDLRLERI